MSRAGGAASKAGLLYEALWTVWHGFLPVVRGEATSIHLEPPAEQGVGIEFRLVRGNGRVEVHQCKVDHRTAWTTRALDEGNVLQPLLQHLATDPALEATFVSGQKTSLGAAAEAAKSLADDAQWTAVLNETDKAALSMAIDTFWDGDADRARSDLRRLQLRTMDGSSLREEALGAIGGERSTATATLYALIALVLIAPGLTLSRGEIIAHLEECGLNADESAASATAAVQANRAATLVVMRSTISALTSAPAEGYARLFIDESVKAIDRLSEYPTAEGLELVRTMLRKAGQAGVAVVETYERKLTEATRLHEEILQGSEAWHLPYEAKGSRTAMAAREAGTRLRQAEQVCALIQQCIGLVDHYSM